MGGILARSSWLEAALIAIYLACGPALAQAPATSAGDNGKSGPAPAAKPAARSEQQAAPPPSPEVIVMLVRNTLIAFNQANLTGDYAVLLALAAPDFQKNNDRAKLSEQFASFREQKIDVSPVAVLPPQFVQSPAIDGQGLLRLAGFFPSQPLQLRFSLAYQVVEGRWRYVGLAVDARQAQAQAAPATKSDSTAGIVPTAKPTARQSAKSLTTPARGGRTTDPPTTNKW
jgi:hypothetical protein